MSIIKIIELILILAVPVIIMTIGLSYLLDKDRPESRLGKIYGAILWINLPIIFIIFVLNKYLH